MGKKILVLEGSPRKKSNTAALCDSFIKGAEENGHFVERIFIRDQRIGGCLSCGACHRNGGSCVQQDDMKKIYDAIAEAEVIVFSSPVYFYSWTAQMKAVLDRMFALEATLSNKTFYLVITGEAPEEQYMENMVNSYRLFIGCFRNEGNKNGGEMIGVGATSPDDIRNSEAAQKAYQMGRELK